MGQGLDQTGALGKAGITAQVPAPPNSPLLPTPEPQDHLCMEDQTLEEEKGLHDQHLMSGPRV